MDDDDFTKGFVWTAVLFVALYLIVLALLVWGGIELISAIVGWLERN